MKTAQSVLKEIEAELEKVGMNFPFINFKEIGFKIDRGISLNCIENEVIAGFTTGPLWADPIASLSKELKRILEEKNRWQPRE